MLSYPQIPDFEMDRIYLMTPKHGGLTPKKHVYNLRFLPLKVQKLLNSTWIIL